MFLKYFYKIGTVVKTTAVCDFRNSVVCIEKKETGLLNSIRIEVVTGSIAEKFPEKGREMAGRHIGNLWSVRQG